MLSAAERVRLIAEADTEGIIDLLEAMRDTIIAISDREYDRNGDSEVVSELDNLSDILQDKIDEEDEILTGIRRLR